VIGGSLDRFLKEKKVQLDLVKLLRFASTAAAGITFLTDRKIIHKDLAARNILVRVNVAIKLAVMNLIRLI